MEDIKITRKPVKMDRGESKAYYEKELKRAQGAINDALNRLNGIKNYRVVTQEREAKMAELTAAITIGGHYLEGLKRKIKQLTIA